MSQHTRLAWLVVLLLFLGSVINYMDRAVLGFVMPQIRHSLSLSNSGYSIAVNSFLLFYTLFYVLGGRIADRIGYRRSFVLNTLIWSAAAILHSVVQGIGGLSAARALLGVGEGGYFPTAMRGVARWFPPRDRAKAVSVVLMGVGVGMLFTTPLAAWVAFHYGWRITFFITGGAGLLLAPAWLLLHRKIDRLNLPAPASQSGAAAVADVAVSQPGVGIRFVLRRRLYLSLLVARAITDAVWFFYLFWLPGYFQEMRGFDLHTVGILFWIPYLSADVGSLAGAWASSGLMKRGFSLNRSRKTVLVASGLLCLLAPCAYFVSIPSLTIALLSIAFFGQFSWGSNMHTAITEVTPKEHVGVLYGLTGAAGTVAGMISQALIGHFTDSVGYGPLFVAAGVIFAVAICLVLAAGKIEVFTPVNKVKPQAAYSGLYGGSATAE